MCHGHPSIGSQYRGNGQCNPTSVLTEEELREHLLYYSRGLDLELFKTYLFLFFKNIFKTSGNIYNIKLAIFYPKF